MFYETGFGLIEVNNPKSLELGELVVTDSGVELEVVATGSIPQFEVAPKEVEDWGE